MTVSALADADSEGLALAGPLRGFRARQAFLAVVAGSTLLRLLVWCLIWKAPFASDATEYITTARTMLTGQPFVPYWPPGVPILLAQLLRMGVAEPALRILPLLFWLLCCWALYRLASALRITRVAWLILLVFSLLPDTIQMSLEPMTQMPAAALLLLALGAAIRLIRLDAASPARVEAREFILFGLSLGGLCLVRPSAMILLLVLPVACVLFRRRALKSVLLAWCLAVVMIGSWVWHAHRMTNHWVINTANTVNVYYGNNPWTPLYRTWYFGSHAKFGSAEIQQFPEYAAQLQQVRALPELDQAAAYQHLGTSYIAAHPGAFLLRTFNRVRVFFGFDSFTSAALSRTRVLGLPLSLPAALLEAVFYLLLIAPAAFFAAAAPARFWREPAAILLAGAVILYGLPYWLTMSHPTYHFPVLQLCAALGALAWSQTGVRSAIATRRGAVAVAVLLLIQGEWIFYSLASLRHGA